MTEKPTAQVFDASGKKETAPQSFMQDLCFLCSNKIGESDPRQFYKAPNGTLMLGHTGCINKFKANGEVWPESDITTDKPAPRVDDFGDVRRVSYGNARLTFTPRHLALSCDDLIIEKGLKAVIPDLIEALKAVEASL